jgi:hydroxymethylglutaryl-CoA lyase
MLKLPSEILVAEVGPRDGLQGHPHWVDTDTKVRIVDLLTDLGLPVIEVASFSHPGVVPNMRDAEDVFARIRRKPGVVYRGQAPNVRGAMRAVEARVGEMLGLITCTESYTRKNQNMSIDEALLVNIRSFEIAQRHGIPFVMALGMSFWCPYEGLVPPERVEDIVRRFHEAGIRRLYLAGSIGMEDPAHVNSLFRRLYDRFPDIELGFHVHNLSGMATGNIVAALDAGVHWLEGAICGLGGGMAMPTTIGSVGNFPTEDLVTMLEEMGIRTGVEPDRVIATAREIASLLDITPRSNRANGATRQAVMRKGQTNPNNPQATAKPLMD